MSENAKKKYRVLLPVSFDQVEGIENGRVFQHGEEVELDLATATAYGHALAAIEEGE